MTDEERDEINKMYDEARHLGLLSSGRAFRYFSSLYTHLDPALIQSVRWRVERARFAQRLHTDPLQRHRPLPEVAYGPIRLGVVVGTGDVYGADREDVHVVIVGPTGTGKSVANRNIINCRFRAGESSVIFSKKRDARGLALRYPSKFILFRVVDQDFRFNPLEAGPGVPLLQANCDAADALCHTTNVLTASKSFILALLAQMDVLLGTGQDPARRGSLYELCTLINEAPVDRSSHEVDYKATTKNRVTGLLAILGTMFGCSRGHPIEQILADGYSLIFETDGLYAEAEQYFLTSFVMRLFTSMRFTASPLLKYVNITTDDAQHIWDINQESHRDKGLPLINQLVARFREVGCVVAAVQVASLLAMMVRQNAGLKIVLRQNDMAEARICADMVGLPQSEARALLELKLGEAVCFKPGYPFPVRVRLDYDPGLDVR